MDCRCLSTLGPRGMSDDSTMCPQGPKRLKYNAFGIQYLSEKTRSERLGLPSWCNNLCLPRWTRRLRLPRRCRKHHKAQCDSNSEQLSRNNSSECQLLSPPSRETLGDDYVEYDLENIVISGGGTKGYAFVGALKALEDAGVLAKIRRIAGTSAGAICAGLLSVGCTPQEIANMFKGDVKKLFHDQSCICCCGLPKIYRRFGINAAERFKRIYGEHIARKTGNPNITFGEVYKEYGRELCIVVTNLSQMRSEYFHYTTTPDLPIRVAVRMSMSFPVIFEPIWCDVNGTLDLYSDGGVLNQYPIHCFDGPDLELNHNSETDEVRTINEKTIGLYVVSERAVDHKIWQQLFGEKIPTKPTYIPNTKLARTRLNEELAKWKRVQKLKKVDKEEIKSDARQQKHDALQQNIHYETITTESVSIGHFADFMQATLETILVAQRKASIKPEDLRRTVAINCGYIGTNDYVIEPGDREFMIQQGYLHTVDYLKDYVQRARNKQREGCHLARSKGSTGTFKSLSSVQTVV